VAREHQCRVFSECCFLVALIKRKEVPVRSKQVTMKRDVDGMWSTNIQFAVVLQIWYFSSEEEQEKHLEGVELSGYFMKSVKLCDVGIHF
jgi:hypothetical protein